MQCARFGLVLLLAANVQAQTKDIVATAVANNFTILAEALTKAGLVDTFQGPGPFTVFAPTDAAFAATFTAMGATKEQLLASTSLGNILKYHVVSGNVKSTSLTNGMTPATVNGANLTIAIDGTTVKVNTATVIAADVMCTNGVIHVIDQVLLPPRVPKDIVDTALAVQPPFTILAEALTKAKLVTTLKGTGPFTVFAPTDDAFAAALTILGATKEQLLARDDLAAILTYHVVGGTVKSTDLTDGMTPATVNGAKVAITIKDSKVMVNTATVLQADVMCSNGVIHVIDQVILPPATTTTTVASTTAAGAVAEEEEESSLRTTTTAASTEASAAYTAQGSVSLMFGAISLAFLFA